MGWDCNIKNIHYFRMVCKEITFNKNDNSVNMHVLYTYVIVYICDPVCEKGSYSLSNCIYMVTHNLTGEYGTSLKFGHSTTLTWQ